MPLSILDLAPVGPGETVADAFTASVDLARRAEAWGYTRIWYAEHHNMPAIASAATSVLIAHVASQTSTIRLGAGGIMLPNHSPLLIAEQFGTLAALHPGRIDLGLGRAPGTDQATARALRTTVADAERFPQDVQELRAYLGERTLVPGVEATPGRGSDVPVYILGSSLFGARLAAALGLPYAFASHFAPAALEQAVALYRAEFRPSPQLDAPYVIAGVGVIVADTDAEATDLLLATRRRRVGLILGRPRQVFSDAEADEILRTEAGRHVDAMLTYTAVGTPRAAREYLEGFRTHADADELMVASVAVDRGAWLRSLERVAGVCLPARS
ncbi:MAG: LLM class flavin-dependent oxidoreductase [Thermoleophilia bacterium]|nr:LLM class flavin-dependent oxidoreductase [Thermoleophilia bacterium]